MARNVALDSPWVRATRTIVTFLQWRFSLSTKGNYKWSPHSGNAAGTSGQLSEIFIGASLPIDPEEVGRRPAITVQRGPGSYQGVGIGDRAVYDVSIEDRVYLDLLPCTMNIHVLSRIPMEAEGLAFFVDTQIRGHRMDIMAKCKDIHSFGARASFTPPTGAGSLVSGASDVEWTAVTLSYPTYLSSRIQVQRKNLQYAEGIHLGLKVGGSKEPNEREALPPKIPLTSSTEESIND